MNFSNIVFFNHFRNGDIHVSREFVRKIMCKVQGINFYYAHKNDVNLLADIGLQRSDNFWEYLRNPNIKSFLADGILFLSTWYAAGNKQFLNFYGISFDCLYELFNDHCKTWLGFELVNLSNNPFDFFPVIDYNQFYISKIPKSLGLCVLVCNGPALSNQATNFNLTNPVVNLAKRYPNIKFILTNVEGKKVSGINNVVYSGDIIAKSSGSDLNENSYLSTLCSVIVGRFSGAYTFSVTQDNLMDTHKTMLSFASLTLSSGVSIKTHNWLGPKFHNIIKYKAKVLNSNAQTSQEAEMVLNKLLQPFKA